MEKQIELLKKYGIKNYSIKNDKIVTNSSLDLSSLRNADRDRIKNNVKQLKTGYNDNMSNKN